MFGGEIYHSFSASYTIFHHRRLILPFTRRVFLVQAHTDGCSSYHHFGTNVRVSVNFTIFLSGLLKIQFLVSKTFSVPSFDELLEDLCIIFPSLIDRRMQSKADSPVFFFTQVLEVGRLAHHAVFLDDCENVWLPGPQTVNFLYFVQGAPQDHLSLYSRLVWGFVDFRSLLV